MLQISKNYTGNSSIISVKKEYSFERRAEELIEIAEKYGKKTEVL